MTSEIAKAIAGISNPGGLVPIVERFVKTDSGTTNAPHLAGPTGQGQMYRTFDTNLKLLANLYQMAHGNATKEFLVYAGPDAIGGVERFTFLQVLEEANALANYLVSDLGVKKGDRVAMAMRNYPEWCFAFMAATSIGAVAVPTNSLWNEKELEYGMADSGASVIFCDFMIYNRIKPLIDSGNLNAKLVVSRVPAGNALPAGVLLFDDVQKVCAGRPLPPVDVDEEDNAIIMYTSGTTGNPKGVVSTQRAVMSAMNTMLYMGVVGKVVGAIIAKGAGNASTPKAVAAAKPPPPQQATLCPVPLFHATGSHAIFLASFLMGRKLVLMYKWDASEALKLVQNEKITSFTGVPTMSLELVTHPDFAKFDTSTLSRIGGGGAPPPKTLGGLVDKATKGRASAGQGYGLTETNAITVSASAQDYKANPASCGKATVLVDLKVVGDDGAALPTNGVGELLIRSAANMKEYWNKPEATAEAMTEDGWFRTGDIGRVDEEGYVYIMDRAKDLIIRGGENISCAEVESAVYEHPAVAECAVFGMPDERLGEVVAVAITPKPGFNASNTDAAEMRAFFTERLAKFKVPAEIYIWAEQLPRGPTGKIPKRAIRQQIQSGEAKAVRVYPAKPRL
jgi:long-chain acyl-CoA synthetase